MMRHVINASYNIKKASFHQLQPYFLEAYSEEMLKNDRLDILGQQPSLHKLYTQIYCIYRIIDPSTHDHIS